MKEIKFVKVYGVYWMGYQDIVSDFKDAKCYQGTDDTIISAMNKRGYEIPDVEIYTVNIGGADLVIDRKIDLILQ